MEYKNIKELMKKYWDGETNLQEESTLKTYFAGADVHPTLEQYKSLFTYYSIAREDKSLDSIDTAVLEYIQGKAVQKEAKVRSLPRLLRVAAAVMVLCASMFVFWNITSGTNSYSNSNSNVTIYDGKDEDPEEAKKAMKELKAALALVSNKLEDGKRQALIGISRTKTIPTLK